MPSLKRWPKPSREATISEPRSDGSGEFRSASPLVSSAGGRVRFRFIDSEVVESPELALDLIRALQQITPRQRAVVILQLYGAFTTAEVATLLGMAQPTVRVHFSQGRKRLRRSLEASDG